ncbi:MAG: hypothetical protein J5896_05065 [Alphaproteobacteria bacterium]|nr:hypothetical protein [Alphaproteobacteria bacterium]
MNKTFFTGFFACVFLFSLNIRAQIKFDGSNAVGKGIGSVVTQAESGLKQVNSAAKSCEEQIKGNPIKVKYETYMAMSSNIGETVSAGAEEYGSGLAEKAGIGEAYISNPASVTGEYEAKMDALASSDLASTATLTKQRDALKKQMDTRKTTVGEELAARIRQTRENIDIGQEMYDIADTNEKRQMALATMATSQAELEQLNADFKGLSDDNSAYLQTDEEYASLKEQYDETEAMLAEALERKAQSSFKLNSMFANSTVKKSKEEKKADYQAVGDSNFVSPDEPLVNTTVQRIEDERNKNLVEAVISAYAVVVRTRASNTKIEDKTEQVSDNSMEADYDMTANRLASEQIIDKIKRLGERLDIEVQDLKLATAGNMKNQGFKMNNPNKNPSELYFDDYVLTEDELKNKGFGG